MKRKGQGWLIISRHKTQDGRLRMRFQHRSIPPDLSGGEVAVKVSVNVPDTVFDVHWPEVEFELDEDSVVGPAQNQVELKVG